MRDYTRVWLMLFLIVSQVVNRFKGKEEKKDKQICLAIRSCSNGTVASVYQARVVCMKQSKGVGYYFFYLTRADENDNLSNGPI